MNANRIFEILETYGCTEDKSVLKAMMQVWLECSADNMVEIFELKEKVKKLEEQLAHPLQTYQQRPYPYTGTPSRETLYPTITCDTSSILRGKDSSVILGTNPDPDVAGSL